jgi:hypothetical protein
MGSSLLVDPLAARPWLLLLASTLLLVVGLVLLLLHRLNTLKSNFHTIVYPTRFVPLPACMQSAKQLPTLDPDLSLPAEVHVCPLERSNITLQLPKH